MATVGLLFTLVTGLLALALGVIVWSRAPRQLANMTFAGGMVGLAAIGFAHMILMAWETERATWGPITVAAETLALPVWALFSVAFARGDVSMELRRWWSFLIAIGALAVSGVVAASGRALVGTESVVDGQIRLNSYGKALAIIAMLTIVFILFQLELTLRQSRGLDRWKIKYFVLGVGGVFAFRLFVLSQTLLTSTLDVEYLPIQSVASLIGFGLIGFCLVRHRLLDVNVFISRHVIYRSVTLLAVGGYLLTLGLAGSVVRWMGIVPNLFLASLAIFTSALALLIALLSEAVRRRVKRAITAHFYRHKYDYRREWTEFTRKLASVVTREELAPRIMETLVDAMGLSKAALFLHEEGRGYRRIHAVGAQLPDRLDVDGPDSVTPQIAAGEKSVLAALHPDDPLVRAVAPLCADGFTFLVPLVANGIVLGFFAIAPAVDSSFSQEDDELLGTVAAQAGTAFLNARLTEQVAQTREREALSRVATFMLHDLKSCVSMLSLVVQNAERVGADPAFQADALRAIADTVRKMRELIARLSHLPKGLELKLAPLDLNELVHKGVERAQRAGNGRICFSVMTEPLSLITADAQQMETVLDNLLMNALEAMPEDGDVRVRTARRNGSVLLEISDTGPGIPAAMLDGGLFTPFQTSKPHGLGVGLYQVKSIVEAHGGWIRVRSEPGAGTIMQIELPVPE